jgi:tetratricopeptide (TPR) repeat protein
MSPEQAAGDPAVDHRADIYAWGILAYELLAGAHPFADRRSVQSLITAQLVEQPSPLDVVAPRVSPDVSALVMRCLAKNPNDRPSGAREIVDTLGAVVTGDHSRARSTRTRGAQRTQRFRPRRWFIVATSIVVVLSAGGGGFAWLSRRASGQSGKSAVTSVNSPAYDAYLRGKVRLSSENREDNEAAVAALRQAIAADPSFAPAYAALGRAFSIKAFYFAPDSEKKKLVEDAEVAVEKALSLDPNLAEAHFARGLMLWTPGRRFPHDQAVRAFRQALTLDPKLDEAHHQLAVVYFHVGLLDKAQTEIEAALAINPGNTLARFRLGVIDMYRGDYQGAYEIFNSTPLATNPTLWAFQMATAQFRLGHEREAADLIDRFLRDYPKDEGGVGNSVRAMMLAKAGRRREADASIAKALELGRTFGHFHHSAYNIASAYALLGDHEQALHWLQDAADNGFPCYPLFAKDKHLDPLRGDPRFIEFMAKQRKDWEQRQRLL